MLDFKKIYQMISLGIIILKTINNHLGISYDSLPNELKTHNLNYCNESEYTTQFHYTVIFIIPEHNIVDVLFKFLR